MNATAVNTFVPLSWQIGPWRTTRPVVLLTGSAGGGKSRVCAEKAHGFCMRYPGSTVLILRKTRASMINSTVLFMDEEVIGSTPGVVHRKASSRWEYDNGSYLVYGGMANDDQREHIRSIGAKGGVDLIWMEEATKFTELDYNELRARLRGKAAPWRQIILSTNPDGPGHWINKRLIRGGEAEVIFSQADYNNHLPGDYHDVLESLTGVQYERLTLGKWVLAEGVIYKDYDPVVHLVDLPAGGIPNEWSKYRSVDFGYTNPSVCQWWAEDPDGALWLYREYYKTQTIAKDFGEAIKRNTPKSEHIQYTVADHDAGDRATLRKECDILTVPAIKDVRPGIQKVMDRLKIRKSGKPRLFIVRGALVEEDRLLAAAKKPVSSEEEIGSYVWDASKKLQQSQEFPLKENDHGMDAMRYMIMKRDTSSSMSIKF